MCDFVSVVYVFFKGCRHEHEQENPFNAAFADL